MTDESMLAILVGGHFDGQRRHVRSYEPHWDHLNVESPPPRMSAASFKPCGLMDSLPRIETYKLFRIMPQQKVLIYHHSDVQPESVFAMLMAGYYGQRNGGPASKALSRCVDAHVDGKDDREVLEMMVNEGLQALPFIGCKMVSRPKMKRARRKSLEAVRIVEALEKAIPGCTMKPRATH